jgi:hypothetical protein
METVIWRIYWCYRIHRKHGKYGTHRIYRSYRKYWTHRIYRTYGSGSNRFDRSNSVKRWFWKLYREYWIGI